MIGQSIEDVRRRQTVTGNLSSKVAAHALHSFHDRRETSWTLVERLDPGLLGRLAEAIRMKRTSDSRHKKKLTL